MNENERQKASERLAHLFEEMEEPVEEARRSCNKVIDAATDFLKRKQFKHNESN